MKLRYFSIDTPSSIRHSPLYIAAVWRVIKSIERRQYSRVNLTDIKWNNCVLNCVSGVEDYLDEMANNISAAVAISEWRPYRRAEQVIHETRTWVWWHNLLYSECVASQRDGEVMSISDFFVYFSVYFSVSCSFFCSLLRICTHCVLRPNCPFMVYKLVLRSNILNILKF
jgi:hypothetical protein